jgi:hypothetical protein
LKLKAPKLGDEKVVIHPARVGGSWRVTVYRWGIPGGPFFFPLWLRVATAVVASEYAAQNTKADWQK